MSLRAVHAGTGYQYLLRSVATHDADPQGQSLSDYYAAKGTPPGKWIGAGLAGLKSDWVTSGSIVSEEQMAALYGEGLHPDTDAMMLDGAALSDCKLGRSFPLYSGGVPVLEAIAAAEKTFLKIEGRRPSVAERGEIAETVARPFYMETYGYEHASGQDIIAWVNRERDQIRQAVAGFDFTFSPVKSVSVMWALAEESTASKIAALHHEAVAQALEWAEDNAIYTRRGAGGIEQVTTRGLIASEFTHFDTRGGDPDLHSHVLLANKVQGPDGRWLSLDSRAIHQMHQAISARYDTALHDLLAREMGVEFKARYPHPDKAPVWEVAGIDRRLIDKFSSRRTLARPVYEQLVSEYVAQHHRQPGQRASYALWQKAILDTRDAKKPAQSLAEHRHTWREMAAGQVGETAVDTVMDTVREASMDAQQRPVFDPHEHADLVAVEAVKAVTSRRAQFRRSHVDTAVSTVLKGYRFTTGDERNLAHDAAMESAMRRHVLMLTPPEVMALPDALVGPTGAGIDRHANAELYTTRAVLDAETSTLEAAITPVAVFTPMQAVETALEQHAAQNGWALNEGQQALATHFLNAGTLVAAGVGPAGTGKTASMKVVTTAWQEAGRSVIGLAPSAAAAAVLADDIGASAHTIDSLTFTWRGLHPNQPGKTLSALPIKISEGDMLLVDEAGMSSTENLAALTEIAAESGAVVRLIGDPAQLSAVETGGLFGQITRAPGTVELSQVMRMGADTAQAQASLGLRGGDSEALSLYRDRGWVAGGGREQMLTEAARAFLADSQAGRRSLIIASRNADVDQLNEIIRADRIASALVDTTRQTTVARGDEVGVGDTVIARKNQLLFAPDQRPLGRVVNGQLFTVTGITDTGDLLVHDQNTGEHQQIPADYSSANVHLGYASTIHRCQGATVDTTHAIVDTSVDRAGLYVALTRGRHENRAYVVCEPVLDLTAEDAHMHSAGDRTAPTSGEVLETILSRDTHQSSAIAAFRSEMAQAWTPERREALYRHGVEVAIAAFTEATLPEYVDTLPRIFGQQIEQNPDQYTAVAEAWSATAKAGLDPRDAWSEVTESLDTAQAPGALIAHRLRQVTQDAELPSNVPAPPPATPHTDTQLADWLDTTYLAIIDGDIGQAYAEDSGNAEGAPIDDFTSSYLEYRATVGTDTSAEATPAPSGDWGPATGPDTSADLW